MSTPKVASFKVTKRDAALISIIAKRATTECLKAGVVYQIRDAEMDLTACHANGCPLDLNALYEADAFEFAHDIAGIRKHLDRTTGQLKKPFAPRFTLAAKERRRAAKPLLHPRRTSRWHRKAKYA